MERRSINLIRGWKFFRGDCPEAWARGYDDGGWREIALPHDWSVEEPFTRNASSGGGYLAGGVGWYRGRFALPESLRGARVELVFDGVYRDAQVFINSYRLGRRPSGYATFSYDITPFLDFGDRGNLISVRAEHRETADSRWFTGDGIYRKVTLLVTDPVHVVRDGVAFETPSVTADSADVTAKCEIRNDSDKDVAASVLFRLTRDGACAAEFSSDIRLGAGETGTCCASSRVVHPALWSDGDPCLYDLSISVLSGGETLDQDTRRVGIRSIRFDPDKGFFLNNVSEKIKGVCVHHDAGCLGAAVTREVWERRLHALKEMGANAIRMSHNPHMPELYDLCDEMGFLVMDEAFDEWENGKNKWWHGHNVYPPKNAGYAEDFPEWHERDLTDLVRRDRLHPSIVMWSIGNEIDYPNDPYCSAHFLEMAGNNDSGKPAEEMRYSPDKPDASRIPCIARELTSIVKKTDTTRPVTAAVAFPELSNLTGYCDVMDICGYNYKEKWYAQDHAKYPSRVLYGSENGASYDAWRAVRDNEYISGQFLWTGFDYLGEARGWPIHGSMAGQLDLAGFPKDRFFFRRALWRHDPVTKLLTRRADDDRVKRGFPAYYESWNYRKGERVLVAVATNCPKTELLLNGEPVGTYFLADFADTGFVQAEVPFEPGYIEARSFSDSGECVTSRLYTAHAPAAIRITRADAVPADGISHIEAEIVDEAGVRVPDASVMVTASVGGAASLAGIENGDIADNTDYASPSRRTRDGRILVYIRGTGAAGEACVTLSPDGALSPVSVTVSVV